MSRVKEIESTVAQLSAELAVRARFAKLDDSQWDAEPEDDVSAGRLDVLAAEFWRCGRAVRTDPTALETGEYCR